MIFLDEENKPVKVPLTPELQEALSGSRRLIVLFLSDPEWDLHLLSDVTEGIRDRYGNHRLLSQERDKPWSLTLRHWINEHLLVLRDAQMFGTHEASCSDICAHCNPRGEIRFFRTEDDDLYCGKSCEFLDREGFVSRHKRLLDSVPEYYVFYQPEEGSRR